MLVLLLMYADGHIEESRFCTMQGALAYMASEKRNGAIKYKIEEFD